MIYSLLRGMREARAAKLYEQEVEVFCALVRSDSWLERMKLDIILRNQEVEVFCALVRSDSWLERMKLDIILRNLRAKRRRLER